MKLIVMRINIYSFLLQDIVFSIDLSDYMLYNQICSGKRMNTAFPADFLMYRWVSPVLQHVVYKGI